MVTQHRMLAWQLCGFTGDQDQYCLETLYFCDFTAGGGGWSGTPVPPSRSAYVDGLKPYLVANEGRMSTEQLMRFWYLSQGPYSTTKRSS